MEFEQIQRNQRLIFNSNESFASSSLVFFIGRYFSYSVENYNYHGQFKYAYTNNKPNVSFDTITMFIHIFISKATNVCPIEFSCAHRLFDFILNSRPLIYSFLQGPKTKNNYTDSVRWVHIVCMLLLLINTTAVSKSSKTVNTVVNCGPWASFLISSEFFVSLTCDMRLSC